MHNPKGSSVISFLLCSLLLSLAILLMASGTVFPKRDTPTDSPAGNRFTVILDPGHGGEDGGAVGHGEVYEKHLNLAIAKEVEALLLQKGISVVCTRSEDVLLYDKNVDYKGHKKALDLAARLKIAKETENPIFVSIHMNSFSQSQYRGLQVYYSANDDRSRLLAQTIQDNTKSLLQQNNNRVIKEASSNIYLLDRIQSPAVLVECGFLSNAEECALLADPDYQKKLAAVLADSITQFIANHS